MKEIRELSFSAGPIEYGWGSFTVRVDGEVFQCEASRIGEHPVAALVSNCCELISLYKDPKYLPTFQNNILFEIAACCEPGGMLITFEPEEGELLDFCVYDVTNSDEAWPSYKTLNRPLRQVDGLISYRRLIEETFKVACDLLRTHGITGFNRRWLNSCWYEQKSSNFFPIGHFLYLWQYLGLSGTRKIGQVATSH